MMKRKIFLLAAVLSLQTCSYMYLAATVSETACKDSDGEDQCSAFENAKCDDTAGSMKCECSSGYKEVVVSTDSTCEKDKVSNVECTKEAEGQCTHTVNAECDEADSNAKCRCVNGYREDPNDDTSCVKTLESSCSGNSACPGVVDSVCDDSKCVCKTDHEEKENDCILTVKGTPCSDTDDGCKDISNSICDADAGKCTCSPGFTMKVDECVGNNANSFKTGWMAFLLFFVLKSFN
ncbi:protein draper-like [Ruditapes philippinarum]|uniref:protein draper-like n=1 Tax=Ruditapes philippinarum TaxID=129788 RepID=UPI00295B2592|nr:protein draper-like [Ruditapes philippinarum]